MAAIETARSRRPNPSTPAGAGTDPSAKIRGVSGARCGISAATVPAGRVGGLAGDRYGRRRGAYGLGRVAQEGSTQPSRLLRSQRRAEPCLGVTGARGFCHDTDCATGPQICCRTVNERVSRGRL